jgi:hypothetical protein
MQTCGIIILAIINTNNKYKNMPPSTIERQILSIKPIEKITLKENTVEDIKELRSKAMQSLIANHSRQELSIDDHSKFMMQVESFQGFQNGEKELLLDALSKNQMFTEAKKSIKELANEIRDEPEKITDLFELVNQYPSTLGDLSLRVLSRLNTYESSLGKNNHSIIKKYYVEAQKSNIATFRSNTEPDLSKTPLEYIGNKVDNSLQTQWQRDQEEKQRIKEAENQKDLEYNNLILERPISLENNEDINIILKSFGTRLEGLKNKIFEIYASKEINNYNKANFLSESFDIFENSLEYKAIQKLKAKIDIENPNIETQSFLFTKLQIELI